MKNPQKIPLSARQKKVYRGQDAILRALKKIRSFSLKRTSDSGIVFEVDSPDQIYYRKFYSILEQKHRLGGVRREKDLIDLYTLHRYHRPIEQTVALYRKRHVPFDVEGLIITLDGLKKGEIREATRREFRKISGNLVKEGLNR